MYTEPQKKNLNSQGNLEKKEQAVGIMLPDFTLQSYSNQNSMDWPRSMKQIESLKIHSCT